MFKRRYRFEVHDKELQGLVRFAQELVGIRINRAGGAGGKDHEPSAVFGRVGKAGSFLFPVDPNDGRFGDCITQIRMAEFPLQGRTCRIGDVKSKKG